MHTSLCHCISTEETCDTGDIRLISSGASNREGRLEICISGVWGNICNDTWSVVESQVACRQLGFSIAGIFIN